MTTAQIDDMYAKRVPFRLGNIRSPRQKLTFQQLEIYYSEKKLRLNKEFLTSLDLLDGEKDFLNILLPHFENHEWITNAIVRELTGCAEGSVKRYLRILTGKQILEAHGERKDRRYRLSPSMTEDEMG
ncbi:MAG: hypothetical protein LBH09_00060 [Peptococcaceae bacterium]|nr:hypothetical protein [Peptococcaceae bacterium]